MKITLRDPIGNSVEFDSAPADIFAISSVAKKHLISPTETHSSFRGESFIFVDDIMKVISDYVSASQNNF